MPEILEQDIATLRALIVVVKDTSRPDNDRMDAAQNLVTLSNRYSSELNDPYNATTKSAVQEAISSYKPANSKRTNDPNISGLVFTNPGSNMGMHFAEYNKLLWITIKSISIKTQKNFIRPQEATVEKDADAQEYNFRFLAPLELIESLAHEWAPYESVSQSIQQAYGTAWISSLNQIKAAGIAIDKNSAAYKALLSAIIGTTVTFQDLKTTASSSISDFLRGESIQSWRVDTPLVYKNTERRTYELVFNLVSLEGDPFYEVVAPVRVLQALSCPDKSEDKSTGYNPLVIPPMVFEISTEPSYPQPPLLYIPFAALRQVNPVWRGPYMNGQPMRCELRLTFQEIEPVYNRSVLNNTYGSKIMVTVKEALERGRGE